MQPVVLGFRSFQLLKLHPPGPAESCVAGSANRNRIRCEYRVIEKCGVGMVTPPSPASWPQVMSSNINQSRGVINFMSMLGQRMADSKGEVDTIADLLWIPFSRL